MPEADQTLPDAGTAAETEREAEVEAQLGLVASAATDQLPLLLEENDPIADAAESAEPPQQ